MQISKAQLADNIKSHPGDCQRLKCNTWLWSCNPLKIKSGNMNALNAVSVSSMTYISSQSISQICAALILDEKNNIILKPHSKEIKMLLEGCKHQLSTVSECR